METKIHGGVTALTDRPFNRDGLTMAPRGDVADAAHEALFPMQALDPHVAVLGAAVLFAVLCSRLTLDPQEIHHMGLKVLRSQQGYRRANASLESLRDFAGIRLAGEETTIV